MKKIFIILVILAGIYLPANAQYGFGTNQPNQKALVDMTSTTMGLLIPRMTNGEMQAFEGTLTAADDGMLVYNTTKHSLFIYYYQNAGNRGFIEYVNANTPIPWASITGVPTIVNSFSADGTGFTPNTATTGAVTLSGTLNITHGGTGLSAAGTAGQLIRVNSGATAFEYFTPTYISGNQTITLSGQVTGSGTTAITTTLAQNGATTGQVMTWNGSAWGPATDSSPSYTSGIGIGISGGVITNTAPMLYPVQGIAVSSGSGWGTSLEGTTNGQIIKWNSGNWTVSTESDPVWTAASANYSTTSQANLLYAPIAHVGATGTAHGVATTSVSGFMSAADKTKLDGIVNVFSTTSNVTSNSPGDLATDDFVFGSSQLNNDNNSDHYYRMFFDKSKGAFRVGYDGNSFYGWDDANRGIASMAWGQKTTASSDGSTAWGDLTVASGIASTAWGSYSVASNSDATAWGFGTTASGIVSTAWGNETTANSYLQTTFGQFNTNASGTPNAWVGTERLFVIGNGTADGSRADALVILKNGNTTLNGNLTATSFIGNLTGNAATATTANALSAQYIDWTASSGPTSIANKPTLATVATSGLYSDLTGAPNLSGYALLAGATFTGDVTVDNGSFLYLSNALHNTTISLNGESGDVTTAGNIIPSSTPQTLGTPTNRWAELYLTGASIHLGTETNEAVIGYNTTDSKLTLDKTIAVNGSVLVGNSTADNRAMMTYYNNFLGSYPAWMVGTGEYNPTTPKGAYLIYNETTTDFFNAGAHFMMFNGAQAPTFWIEPDGTINANDANFDGIVTLGSSLADLIYVNGTFSNDGSPVTFGAQIIPDQDNVRDLGAASRRWANVYATNLTGNLTGNVTGNVTGTATNVTGTVAVANGGTGLSSIGTSGQIMEVNSGATGLEWKSGFTTRWFYMPAIKLDLSSGTHTINLYTEFTNQFNSPAYKSASAPATFPNVPALSDIAFIISYNDNSAILNSSLSINESTGVLSYNVSGTPTAMTFMNVIIVIK